MNEGVRRKTKLWSTPGRAALEKLVLAPWAGRRRQELLELLDHAMVALGRRLGIRLYWMWRNGCEYSPSMEFGPYVGPLEAGQGVQ